MDKRGQITLFVILGLVVLIIVGLVIYFLSQARVQEVPVDEVINQNLDARITPLANSVNYCVAELAKEKLVDLASTGGFELKERRTYLTGMIPEYSDNALELFPNSGVIYPYWYEMKSGPDCQTCTFAINMPHLEGSSPDSISSLVQKYVDNNILDCMNKFEDYDTLKVKYGTPKSKVSFNAEDTTVILKWPLEVKVLEEQNVTIKADAFIGVLDLKMRNIYDLATSVLYEVIIDQQALDNLAIQVSDYNGFGKDSPLPPRADTTLGFESPRYWKTSDIKKVLKEEIASNIPLVQVIGSKNHYIVFAADDEFKRNIYYRNLYSLYTEEEQLGNTRIRFTYDSSWPLYVKVNPSNGEIVMPEVNSLSIPFFSFAMTKYDFDYDITYPALITLEDDEAFNGEGFVFQFAVENNIRSSLSYATELNVTRPEPYAQTGGYFTPDQAIVPVEVKVVDAATFQPVEDIGVSYTCVDESGIVGTTKLENGQTVIKTMLPPCVDGRFTGIGPDNYTLIDKKSSIVEGVKNEFLLYAFKDKPIQIFPKKKMYNAREEFEEGIRQFYWDYDPNGIYSKDTDEDVLVILTKIENNNPTGFVQIVEIKENQNSGLVYLRPGDYNLMVISNLNLPFGYNTTEEYMHIDGEVHLINATNFNESIFYGFAQLDNSTSGPIKITAADLANNEYMTVYYAGYELNYVVYSRQLNVLGSIVEASTDNRASLLPKFE